MPTLMFGDWRPDVADYQQQYSKTITNVVARGDGYGPVRAVQAFSDAMAAACRGAYVAYNLDGTVAIFAGTATKLYKMSNSDLSWDEVTRTVGGDYTLAGTDQWQFVQFGDVVVAVNQNDAPQKFTLASSTDFEALGGSPPQGKFVSVVSQHLVISGILNDPDKVQWSALNDIETWTTGTDGADSQNFQDGGDVLGVAGGEFGVVFQKHAIRRMVYVGGDTIFEFERIVDGEGLAAPYSVINAGARIFFLGTSGFQSITAGQYPVSISKERFYRTFLAEWDDGSPQLMIGANEAESSRVWWFYKTEGAASGLFNRAIGYDWALDRAFYVNGISGEYVAALALPGVTLEGLESLGFTNLDTMEISLDDFSASDGVAIGLFDSSHQLGFMTGDALEAIVDTPDYAFDRRYTVTAQRPITDATTVYGSFSTRQRLADTPTQTDETAMNSIGFCPHHSDTRMARFRNRIPAGETWTFITGTEPTAVSTGQQ
jgi:hypothetical protein